MPHGEFQRVSMSDLKRMCLSAGLPFPEEDIDRLIKTCPKDDEDKVAFEDFIVHLEKSQMELINGPGESHKGPIESSEDPWNDTQNSQDILPEQKTVRQPEVRQHEAEQEQTNPLQLQQENEELKSTIQDLQEKLDISSSRNGNGSPSVRGAAETPCSSTKPVLPQIPVDEKVVKRVTRSNNPNKGISNVFPDIKDALPQIDMFGQARQDFKVIGRRKYNVIDPPTEDIFGNRIQTEKAANQTVPSMEPDSHRPQPQIDGAILENIQACMDRNNKRALEDVTSTIERWNGGCTMTRRMLTKIIKHSGLRLPNETVRVLFDKLDVYTDGTVVLRDFFKVFKDAESSVPRGGNDPAQISRNRRAEMQNRAAPWATM